MNKQMRPIVMNVVVVVNVTVEACMVNLILVVLLPAFCNKYENKTLTSLFMTNIIIGYDSQ